MSYALHVWSRGCERCGKGAGWRFSSGVHNNGDRTWIDSIRQGYRDRGIATALVVTK